MSITSTLKTTPPPLICIAALLIAIVLNALWPLVLIPDRWRYSVAATLIIASLLLMPSILIQYQRLNTPFDVRKSPSSLIVNGLYSLSRNPTYVALILLFIGLAVALSNLWLLISLIPATLIINAFVIPEEERHLEQAFGDEYRVYRARVRRWL